MEQFGSKVDPKPGGGGEASLRRDLQRHSMVVNRDINKVGAPRPSRLSITDVAKASGVSVATVSRVLNGLTGVGAETAAHVRDIAGKLEYRPLRARQRSERRARSARAGTGNIAIITLGEVRDWLQLPVMAAAVNGVRAMTDRAGYRLILSEVLDPFNSESLFENLEIDGATVFVSSSFNQEKIVHALEILNARWPVVWVMGGPLPVNVDHICPNNYRIGQVAHAHLSGCGCRNVAYVTTSPRWPMMRERGHGFLDAALDAGRPARTFIYGEDVLLPSSYGANVTMAHDTLRLMQKVASASPKLDGLFVANDRTAVELYPVMIRAGIHPVRDVAVVCCDNEEVRLSGLNPRPASIDIGAEQIGRRAVTRLLKRIAEPGDWPVTIQVTPKLVLP
jgi:LacI family transcriptional regulator